MGNSFSFKQAQGIKPSPLGGCIGSGILVAGRVDQLWKPGLGEACRLLIRRRKQREWNVPWYFEEMVMPPHKSLV